MAKVVAEFPEYFDATVKQYFDGKIWELTEGEDFTSDVKRYRTIVSQAGRAMGLKVTTRIIGNKLFVKANP
jgi:hypothetical protein